MSDLRELYQEVIIDHNRSPRNFGRLEPCNHHAEGFNPLCGDRIQLYLNVEDNHIKEVKFMGSGCAISTASASLMTEMLKNKSLREVQELFSQFHALVTGAQTEELPLGKLMVLAGVREFPVRVKCATLAWHTLQAALQHNEQTVSTEL